MREWRRQYNFKIFVKIVQSKDLCEKLKLKTNITYCPRRNKTHFIIKCYMGLHAFKVLKIIILLSD